MEADASAQPTMERAINATAKNFGRVFDRQMLWCESLEQLLAPARTVSPGEQK
jgi:lipoyl(octanoyl) transferase